jgi:hypothetical protein
MTEEKTELAREEAALLFRGLGREQAKLFKTLLEKAPLKEIGRAFDDMASLMGMILLAVLMSRRPTSSKKASGELDRIIEMFDQAALAGRKVLLAAVRYVRK